MNSKATEPVSISLPGWLIEEMDRVRSKTFRSRSDFIFEAIRKAVLDSYDTPEFWDHRCHELEEESS